MKKWFFPLLLCECTFLSGCVNRQSVNIVSTLAVLGLQQHVAPPTTFTDVYRHRVENDSLNRHPFGQVPLVGLDFSGQVLDVLAFTYERLVVGSSREQQYGSYKNGLIQALTYTQKRDLARQCCERAALSRNPTRPYKPT